MAALFMERLDRFLHIQPGSDGQADLFDDLEFFILMGKLVLGLPVLGHIPESKNPPQRLLVIIA